MNTRGRFRLRSIPSTLAIVAFAGVAGYLVASVLLGGTAEADDPRFYESTDNDDFRYPGADETPEPGATPDRTKPFWYVPYFNADDQAPKFTGEIAGISLGTEPSADQIRCASASAPPDGFQRVSGTPFGVSLDGLPSGVSVWSPPFVTLCDDNGSPLRLLVDLAVAPGVPGVGPTGATVSIARVAHVTAWTELAPRERWSEGEVAGRPAALLKPVVDDVGGAAVFVRDDEWSGSTRIRVLGGSLEFAIEIAEAIYKWND